MKALLVSVEKIWDQAAHCAFTDLIRFKGSYFCALRESDTHFGGVNGIMRILRSSNALVWELVSTVEFEGWDLRDPKLSIMPDGKLMLLLGAFRLNRQKERLALQSLVSFSQDGINWSDLNIVLDREWLWRVTWFQGVGYGVSYFLLNPADSKSETICLFYQTLDGLNYQRITAFQVESKPSEGTIRFSLDGQLTLLLRREGNAWIGTSVPPYEDWLWNATEISLQGPNFLILPNGQMWAAGSISTTTPYGLIEKTALCAMDARHLQPRLIFPSGGDCSYPGMLYETPHLYLTYYSSHEHTTAFYFAKLELR